MGLSGKFAKKLVFYISTLPTHWFHQYYPTVLQLNDFEIKVFLNFQLIIVICYKNEWFSKLYVLSVTRLFENEGYQISKSSEAKGIIFRSVVQIFKIQVKLKAKLHEAMLIT